MKREDVVKWLRLRIKLIYIKKQNYTSEQNVNSIKHDREKNNAGNKKRPEGIGRKKETEHY